MRRLHFLVPDRKVGKKMVDELLLSHIEWKHIHVIAKRGTPLTERIREAHPRAHVEGTDPRVFP